MDLLARRLAAACLLLAVAAPAWADEAEDAFDSLYGNDYRRVIATPSTADDVALAAQLLTAAGAAGTKPSLAAVLYDKAYELGTKAPAGCETAAEAMELLAEQDPAKAAACWDRIVAARQKQCDAAHGAARTDAVERLIEALVYTAGLKVRSGADADATACYRRAMTQALAIGSDRKAEIAAHLDGMAARQKVEKVAADLKARLQADPTDAAARKALVHLSLVDLDDPAAAATFLDDSCDAATRKFLPSVSKGVAAAPELACNDLAEWYRSLGEEAAPAAKAAMFLRARAYYGRFLSLHSTDDMARSQARVALKKMDDLLAKVGGGAATARPELGPGRWVDILDLVDPDRDWVHGHPTDTVQVKGGSVRLVASNTARVTVRCAPSGSYDLRVRLAQDRVGKDRYMFLTLPVGGASVALVLGDGDYADLRSVKTPATKLTAAPHASGQEIVVDVKVQVNGTEAEIAVAVNEKPNLHWKGAASELSIADIHRASSPGCIGLGAFWTDGVYQSVRLRVISGKARMTG